MMLHDYHDRARELDRQDPLAEYRARFHIPQRNDADIVYLCGNSLGLAPRGAAKYVEEQLRDWQAHGVEGHFQATRPWVSFHEVFAPHLAKLVGAEPHEVVAMNTLTVNLHLMLASFYRPNGSRYKVLTGQRAFPSDQYALASQIAWHGHADAIIAVTSSEILSAIEDHHEELALVLLDAVNYYTGEFLDLPAITAAAHRHGITVGFDLAHAAGNVPLHLHEWGVDFAVWCSYKYMNGGPGCPAGCFVHEMHGRDKTTPRLAGWWGHDKATRFQMGPQFDPIAGAEGWQLSNPPILSLAALLASMELFSEIGMSALRTKSVALTGFLEAGLAQHVPAAAILTPLDAARRGSQLSVRAPKAAFTALQARGIVCDWREPDVIRLAPVPLYNRFADVAAGVEVLSTCPM